VFGYPVELAAPVAVAATQRALGDHPKLKLVRFVLYDEIGSGSPPALIKLRPAEA
jgi:O-acetyl-ADP-ribose deacetylase (regulator of RNase III)